VLRNIGSFEIQGLKEGHNTTRYFFLLTIIEPLLTKPDGANPQIRVIPELRMASRVSVSGQHVVPMGPERAQPALRRWIHHF
jgi:hypothetical protein